MCAVLDKTIYHFQPQFR